VAGETGIPVTGLTCAGALLTGRSNGGVPTAGALLTGRSNCGVPTAGAVRDGGRCEGGTAVGVPVDMIMAVRGPPTIGVSAVEPSPNEVRPLGGFAAPGPERRPREAAMRESVS
jgi:hypothetical protein